MGTAARHWLTKGLLMELPLAILSPSGAYFRNSIRCTVNIVKKVVEDLKELESRERSLA
jgi:hypothetical protein